MHDEHLGFGASEAGFSQAKQAGVLAQAGEHGFALPLVLNPQEVNDIGITDGFLDVVSDAAAHLLKIAGNEGGRAAECYVSAELGERPDIRAGHPTVENISENGHL